MTAITRRRMLQALATAAATAGPASIHAQLGSAQRPIRIVVPVAGGTMDLVARLVAPKVAEDMGRAVVVDNKPGAGGVLANEFVVRASADGTTLLVVATGMAINATMNPHLPYDTAKDFSAVTNAVNSPQLLVVHKSVPVETVAALVDYAKANPGLSYGSIGAGTQSHLTMEMFKSAANLNMVHVPYKGAAPAVTDLLAGHVKAGYFVAANVLPYVKSGQLKALASTGRVRMPAAPTVPTMIESGFANFEAVAWIGFMVRAGTPPAAAEGLRRAIVRALDSKDVRDRLIAEGFEINTGSSEEFGTFVRAELTRWGDLVRKVGAVGAN